MLRPTTEEMSAVTLREAQCKGTFLKKSEFATIIFPTTGLELHYIFLCALHCQQK